MFEGGLFQDRNGGIDGVHEVMHNDKSENKKNGWGSPNGFGAGHDECTASDLQKKCKDEYEDSFP